jgi:hypothetical protein
MTSFAPTPAPGKRRGSKIRSVLSVATSMSMKNLADPESACKPVQPGQAAGSERAPGALARFATLAGGGPVLMTTARFGRSPVRNAAYRLRALRPDLDLKLSWRLFASLGDWGKR